MVISYEIYEMSIRQGKLYITSVWFTKYMSFFNIYSPGKNTLFIRIFLYINAVNSFHAFLID